jgi:sodium-dependent dicarboxylate transporter 2/3/5
MTPRKIFFVLLAILLTVPIRLWGPEDLLVNQGLRLFALIGVLWLSEALHLSATALLVPLLAVGFDILSLQEALTSFAHPVIFLFMGGFALSAALHQQELDQLIGRLVLKWGGGHFAKSVILILLATAFLSMWISNTATAAIMIPLGMGLLSHLPPDKNRGLFTFMALAIAYSANIGGMGTVIGSPPNAIAASAIDIDFISWMRLVMPASLLLLGLMVGLLFWVLRPRLDVEVGVEHSSDAQLQRLRPKQRAVLVIFLLTAAGWLLSRPLSGFLGIQSNFDTFVAMAAIVLLMVTGCLNWQTFEAKTNWGVLLLFGGGICLSEVLTSAGTSEWLAQTLAHYLPASMLWLLLLILVAFVVFLTELVSNTASASLLIPIFMSLVSGLGFDASGIAVATAMSASCAFMMPVATPPNAVAYGTGYIPHGQMLKAGFLLNLTSILLISGYLFLVLD